MKKENQELVIILPENMENIPVRIIRNAQEEELVINLSVKHLMKKEKTSNFT